MCFINSPKPQPVRFAATDSAEARRDADQEAALRRRRAGAAANVLTGPSGIPGVSKMGQVAA